MSRMADESAVETTVVDCAAIPVAVTTLVLTSEKQGMIMFVRWNRYIEIKGERKMGEADHWGEKRDRETCTEITGMESGQVMPMPARR